MQYDPSPLEVLFLWGLVGEGGAGWKKELRPELTSKSRESLRETGLLTVTPRKNGALWIELTDKGWAWAAGNLDANVSTRSPASGAILRAWLVRLKDYLARSNVALAEVIGGALMPDVDATRGSRRDAQSPANGNLPQRITEAYLALSGGSWAKRVRIAHLRTKLDDIPKKDLDQMLLGMQSDDKLALYTLDDPQEISADDREGAIRIGHETRHILYMRNSTA